MKKPFFVMLLNQSETILIPLTEESGDLAMFETDSEARKSANENPLGRTFGYEVFKDGGGE